MMTLAKTSLQGFGDVYGDGANVVFDIVDQPPKGGLQSKLPIQAPTIVQPHKMSVTPPLPGAFESATFVGAMGSASPLEPPGPFAAASDLDEEAEIANFGGSYGSFDMHKLLNFSGLKSGFFL